MSVFDEFVDDVFDDLVDFCFLVGEFSDAVFFCDVCILVGSLGLALVLVIEFDVMDSLADEDCNLVGGTLGSSFCNFDSWSSILCS